MIRGRREGGMRILVCAKNDLPALLACNRLASGLAGDEVSFWLSEVTRPDEFFDHDLAALRFLERDLPNRWLLPLIERGSGKRSRGCLTYPELAESRGGGVRIIRTLQDGAILADLEAQAPDLIVSIRFSHIFSAAFLRVPRLGLLNVHPGELPHYAGLFAPFWQMLHERERIGCTVHWIDPGIDTGPVVWQGGLPVDPKRSLLWHICGTYPLGVDELLAIIRDLRSGRRPAGVVQDRLARHYYRLPSRSDFGRFREMGLKIIDFDEYQDLLAPFQCAGAGRAIPERPSPASALRRLA
jgi:hypothetical protein